MSWPKGRKPSKETLAKRSAGLRASWARGRRNHKPLDEVHQNRSRAMKDVWARDYERLKGTRRSRYSEPMYRVGGAATTFLVPRRIVDELCEKQKGELGGEMCAICRTPKDELKKSLCLDHNHDTLALRGFICADCNTGIGFLRENPVRLFDAVRYLLGGVLEGWDGRLMALAVHMSILSKDPSTRVGSVIADDRHRIVSVGYNGFPRGIADDKRRFDRSMKYKLTVHAEVNAILFSERSLHGCTLYAFPFMPCAPCAAMVIQSGIVRVVAPKSDNPRWADDFALATMMFEEAGVQVTLVDPCTP